MSATTPPAQPCGHCGKPVHHRPGRRPGNTWWHQTAECQRARQQANYIARRQAQGLATRAATARAEWAAKLAEATARIAELEALLIQAEDYAREAGAERDEAEAQVARVLEAMVGVPEAPRSWNEVTKAVWLSGWAAACRHVAEALRPGEPAATEVSHP